MNETPDADERPSRARVAQRRSRPAWKRHRDALPALSFCALVATVLISSAHQGTISYAVAIPAALLIAWPGTVSVSLWIRQARNADRRRRQLQERAQQAEQEYESALRVRLSPALTEVAGREAYTSLHQILVERQARERERTKETRQQEDARRESGSRPPDRTAPPTFPELWNVTHRKLDYYHEIATGQATRAFRNAQIAMGVGFLLLIAFVVIALSASTTAGSLVVGGLGAVGAAMAAYISRTFVRSHEVTSGHLRAYFEQPVALSRYLAAERLIADAGLSEERRAEVLAAVVEAMVAESRQDNTDRSGSGST